METKPSKNSSKKPDKEPNDDISSESNVIIQSFTVRAQKKLASTFGGKRFAKHVLDEETSDLIKNVHRIVYMYSESKETANMITKYIIKIAFKIAILQHNKVFKGNENTKLSEMKEKVHNMSQSFISLLQRKRRFKLEEKKMEMFLNHLASSEEAFIDVTRNHLSQKSINKFQIVTNFLKDKDFIKFLAGKSTEIEELVESILEYIQDKIDRGFL